MEELERNMLALKEELEEAKNSRELAARIGQQLMQSNQDLQKEINRSHIEYMSKIEELKQDLFAQERRAELKTSMANELQEEIEALQKKLTRVQEYADRSAAHHESVERQKSHQISCMQLKIDEWESLVCELKNNNAEMGEQLTEAQIKLREKLASQTDASSDEVSQLRCHLEIILAEKENIESDLKDVALMNERLKRELDLARNQVILHNEELESARKDAVANFNALGKSREENRELNQMVDDLRMETQSMAKKGNSLFGEVEDRRIEAEKELISVQVKYEALEKQYSLTKEQLHKLNLQIDGLLQMCRGRADERHVERLQQQLARSYDDIAALEKKVKAYERMERSDVDHYDDFKNVSGNDDSASFIDYLKTVISSKDKEIASFKSKASQEQVFRRLESHRIAEKERLLYSAESERDRLQAELIKVQLRLDQMMIQYEPDKANQVEKGLKVVNEEIIPLDSPITPSTAISGSPGNSSTAETSAAPVMRLAGKENKVTPPDVPKTKTVSFSPDVPDEKLSPDKPKPLPVKQSRTVNKVVKVSADNNVDCKQQ